MVMYALVWHLQQLIMGPEATSRDHDRTVVAPLAGGDPTRYAVLAAMTAILVGVFALLARVARWVHHRLPVQADPRRLHLRDRADRDRQPAG